MLHKGNISNIHPQECDVVDVVIGGSPCQDLSVAGKRAGLGGARSGLFMEQIRIIKEMREHDEASGRADRDVRPRYCVWENVPGALSSNNGEDFRIVLEEFCRIKAPGVTIPRPDRGGVERCWVYRGRRLQRCLAHHGRSILGSPPASPSNRTCGRFCRTVRTRNTV